MTRRRAYPTEKDSEFLLYLVYSEDRGMRIGEFRSSCQHYNRWEPTEHTLRAALGRLTEHGLAAERAGVFVANPDVIEQFDAARDPNGDQFEDMATLAEQVARRLGDEQ